MRNLPPIISGKTKMHRQMRTQTDIPTILVCAHGTGRRVFEYIYILVLVLLFRCYRLGKLVAVTAKIPEDLRKRLEEMGVNVSGLIREVLEREVRRLEMEKLRRLAGEAGEILRRVPAEELVKIVRESREER